MDYVIYILYRTLIAIFAIIPMRMVYVFADIMYFLLYYVIKYRKKVVLENLKKSFPEKKDKEIKKIAKRYYRNLSDIMTETLKGNTIGKNSIVKRFNIKQKELADKYFDKGQNIICATGHYGNWEWGPLASSLQLKHDVIVFYKPLKNKYIDRYLKRIRMERGSELVPVEKTRQSFTQKRSTPAAFVMVGDQSPSNARKAYWTIFLNQETACLQGIEFFARLLNLPVLYFEIIRVKRGYYDVDLKLITETPKETEKGEITQKYFDLLEKTIKNKPEDWLWSHKRWKKQRPPNVKLHKKN